MRRVAAFWTVTACVAALSVVVRGNAEQEQYLDLIELGRRLFHEPAASSSGRASCADCHDPSHAYSDPRVRSSVAGVKTRRHSQTLLDLNEERLHWDGESDDLEHLILRCVAAPDDLARVVSSRLFGNYRGPEDAQRRAAVRSSHFSKGDRRQVQHRSVGADHWLRARGRYGRGFAAVFGDREITRDRIVAALAEFVRSIESGQSRFDRFVSGDAEALSPSGRRGLALFRGRARCVQCHPLDGARAISDGRFHDTGIATRSEALGLAEEDMGLGDWNLGVDRQFKTPNLRDVALRPPYMHDGSFATLEEVVRHYNAGGLPHVSQTIAIAPLDLSPEDCLDLVAFLRSLSSERLTDSTAVEPPALRVRVVDLNGRPMPTLRLSALPAGGPRAPGATSGLPVARTTDDEGHAKFPLPPTTHYRVLAAGYELGDGRPLPDWERDVRLVATPLSRVSIRVHWVADSAAPEQLIATLLEGGGREDESAEGPANRVSLVRLRETDDGDSLYVAQRRARRGRSHYRLEYPTYRAWHHLGIVLLDLRGGASEPIIVTDDELASSLPPWD